MLRKVANCPKKALPEAWAEECLIENAEMPSPYEEQDMGGLRKQLFNYRSNPEADC